ncbi:P-loop containing nucleoside triphosphate hydrolase protein, partial [Thamnocephalis sphaerospora]
FPQLRRTELDLPIGTLVGRVLFPFGISFLLPIFVIMLVREKEDRIYVMMSMSGMKPRNYYMAHILHFLALQLIASVVFIITGVAFQMQLFTLTDPAVYIILLLIWAFAQITLAFFLACFFSKSRTALVTVFLLVLGGVMINAAVDQLSPDAISVAYFIWPPFAFYRALSRINVASVSNKVPPYRLSDLTPSNEVSQGMIALTCGVIIYLLLAGYLNSVLPREYGVRRPWHFPITDLVKWLKNRTSKRAEPQLGGLKGEDDDVKAERQRVLSNQHPAASPLILKRMRKVYTNGKLAVKDVTFAIESGVVFGLLGPNGAGKTTLISILTGLYESTAGHAWLNGFDTHTEMDQVYMTMGVCPQHDILWEDLTVEEHLLFYARLKGVPVAEEESAVTEAIEHVALQKFRTRLSKGLSGGEKRRLSIAISLIGNPGVVFLDEPTTGLDPEVKRVIWNIIDRAKQGRTVILTTHSMEEAEVLCSRIGIMAKGALRCFGSVPHLKDVYGKGFRVSLTGSAERLPAACRFLESLLPQGWISIDSFTTSALYEFKPSADTLSTLFETLEARKEEFGIEDWGISQTSLEEVFLRIVNGGCSTILRSVVSPDIV